MQPDDGHSGPRRTLIRAGAVIDATGVEASPGAILLDGPEIVAAGDPVSIGTPSDAGVVHRPGDAILPALVNAHAHLDLSHLPPAPCDDDFVAWIERVRVARRTDATGIAEAVGRGVALARAGGTAAVGDIAGAGSLAAVQALRDAGLPGVSFLEVFGLGPRQGAAIEQLQRAVAGVPLDEAGVRLGLQPHAPYTCGPDVYRAAAALGRPLATHLAETPEEAAFTESGTGPIADFLVRLGVWSGGDETPGGHPVDVVAEALAGTPIMAVHLNYIEPGQIDRLRARSMTPVYCPRASAALGHPRAGRAPHPYRAMLDAGIDVALGTDGLLCLDTPDRISVLDDMRFLHRRDGTDPRVLLAMATRHGAAALGLDPRVFTLRPGPTAGLLAVSLAGDAAAPARHRALAGAGAPAWVAGPFDDAVRPEAALR